MMMAPYGANYSDDNDEEEEVDADNDDPLNPIHQQLRCDLVSP